MAKLVCQAGPTAGHEYPLSKDHVILGRQSACDIQIMDTMSSRQHCEVRREGRFYVLVDLSSRNGTLLNGKKVVERQLAFGDRIRVGEVEYLLVKESGDADLRDLLSKYEILEKIGEGGMGIVYKANQRSMARIVALKVLSPKYASRQKFVDQFIREARAAGQLNHPNIIQVHDVGTENGIHFFSMEFIEGATCMQILKQSGAFPVSEALEVVRQTARALEYAHSQRLIHQDIKPDNIMIGPNNQVKLADLGISKTFDEVEAEEGGQRRVMGTPHYMAPEAALGKRVDHRVDIYSLGATMYHLLTGKTPFTGTNATDVLKAHVMDPFPPIHDLNPEVPEPICALVERLVAKKPEDRYQSATEVVEEIQRLKGGLGLGTERIGGAETMLLRRFARGAANGPGDAAGTAASTAAGTTGATPGDATGEQIRLHRHKRSQNHAALIILILVLVVALAVGAWLALPHLVGPARAAPDDAKAGDPPARQPATPTTAPISPTPVANPAPAPAPAPVPNSINTVRILKELDELESTLRTSTAADPGLLLKRHEALMALEPTGPEAARAAAIAQGIQALFAKQTANRTDAALTDFERELKKLIDERNFDLAQQRCDNFAKVNPSADAGLAADRLARLKAWVESSRQQYHANLGERVKRYAALGDLARLKEERDRLPPSLLGGPVEQDILKAITQVEADKLKKATAILDTARLHLARWDGAAIDRLNRDERPDLAGLASVKALDELVAAAHRLSELSEAIGKGLQGRKVRFRGKIRQWTDPDLLAASAKSLRFEVPAGEVEIRWQDIPAVDLDSLAKLVLAADADAYRPAIDLLGAAQAKTADKPAADKTPEAAK